MIFDRIQQSAIVQLIKKYAFPPDQSVTTAKLGYNMREAILDRTVSQVLYTDGTSAGTWQFATGAYGFYEGSYQLLPDMIALVTDVDTTRGVAHLRAAPGTNTGTGGTNLILVRDGPKIFRANVKYDGTANAGTWAFVGFNYQHTLTNQNMVCFTCNGTSNWFATIMEDYVLISSVDTGVPASDWADLQIRITETGAYFELIVTDEWGNTSVDSVLHTYLWVDAPLDSVLLTNVGACIRKRAAGSVQHLYIKQMFLQDNRAEGTYSKIVHQHALTDLLQTGALTGQIPLWSGTEWGPSTVSGTGTVTSVTAGTGLTGGTITIGGTIALDTTDAFGTKTNQATVILIHNDSGVTLNKGQAVYVTGQQGQRVTVALANANSEATAATTIGIMAETVVNNANGYVQCVGQLDGWNTNHLSETSGSNAIWLSAWTGTLGTTSNVTSTRPTQPNHGVALGWCLKQAPGSAGQIYTKVNNGQELDEIHDVLITSPAAGNVLWRDSDSLWKNKTLVIDDISDIKETKILVETDCNAAGEFSTYSLNGGSNVFTTTGLTHCDGHWGILRCGTAAVANSVAGIGAGTITDSVIFGTYKHETTAIVYIPNLSNATNRFYVEHGFSDNRGGVPTDAVMFSYIDTQMGGNWGCLAYNNNVLTSKDSGVPVSALTWYKLRVVVNVNGSAEFYIDGTKVATTTDFPVGSVGTGSARATANGCTIRKTVGVTARNLDIDYYNLQIGTAR